MYETPCTSGRRYGGVAAMDCALIFPFEFLQRDEINLIFDFSFLLKLLINIRRDWMISQKHGLSDVHDGNMPHRRGAQRHGHSFSGTLPGICSC